MVTPQATEMQVEGEISVEEAVKEMLEIEVEEDEGDPFKGMNNSQVVEIYYKMKLPVITWLEASYVRCSQDFQQGMLTPLRT